MAKWLRYIGTVLALCFIGFVVWRNLGDIPPVELSSVQSIAMLLGALLAYAVSQVLGAVAWAHILSAWSVSLHRGQAASQHLVSQFGKYLPGNVGQFVGRYALARQDGVPGPVIGLAMLFEVGLVVGTAVLLVSAAWVFLPSLAETVLAMDAVSEIGARLWLVPLIALAASVFGGWFLLRAAQKRNLPATRLGQLSVPIVLYFLTFLVLGASVSLVGQVIEPKAGVPILYATSVFALAWVAGFVVPGAPGGLGVRDGIVAIGLGLVIGEGAGLTVSLLHRAVSIVGDCVIFAVAWWQRGRYRSSS